jgi:hypothetical protein
MQTVTAGTIPAARLFLRRAPAGSELGLTRTHRAERAPRSFLVAEMYTPSRLHPKPPAPAPEVHVDPYVARSGVSTFVAFAPPSEQVPEDADGFRAAHVDVGRHVQSGGIRTFYRAARFNMRSESAGAG